MDYGGRNYVDISPWMLVEATGDSEFDFGLSTCCCAVRRDKNNTGSCSAAAGAALAEDDAISSCRLGWEDDNSDGKMGKALEDEDSCSTSSPDNGDDENGDNEAEINGQPPNRYLDDEAEEDEDEDVVNQVQNHGGGVTDSNGFGEWKSSRRRPEQKPPGDGITMKQACCGRRRKQADELMMMNQRDTDRLFWESCLSS